MAFHHSLLATMAFPRRRLDDREFHRRVCDGWVFIQSGMLDLGNGAVAQPIPFGAMARLVLIWISTLAKRHGSREVEIGRFASEFLRLLGYPLQGHYYWSLYVQIHAIAACRLQFGLKGTTYSGNPVDKFTVWDPALHDRRWPGIMVLSQGFFDELAHAIPLDARALRQLRSAPLAVDIYTWLAQRLHRIGPKPLRLSWASVKLQFGEEYKGAHGLTDFAKSYKEALRSVLIVYPQARVQPVWGGIELKQSSPPVPPLVWPAYPKHAMLPA